MPATKRRERFDYCEIVERIEKARERSAVTGRALAEASGMDAARWSRKMRGEVNQFTLREFGAIAEALDAPAGWPFVEWGSVITVKE